MTKVQVYIVFRDPSNLNTDFVDVFFDRKSAEDWIAATKHPEKYFIKTYTQP